MATAGQRFSCISPLEGNSTVYHFVTSTIAWTTFECVGFAAIVPQNGGAVTHPNDNGSDSYCRSARGARVLSSSPHTHQISGRVIMRESNSWARV